MRAYTMTVSVNNTLKKNSSARRSIMRNRAKSQKHCWFEAPYSSFGYEEVEYYYDGLAS